MASLSEPAAPQRPEDADAEPSVYYVSAESLIPLAFHLNPDIKSSYERFVEELELVQGACHEFDPEAFLKDTWAALSANSWARPVVATTAPLSAGLAELDMEAGQDQRISTPLNRYALDRAMR